MQKILHYTVADLCVDLEGVSAAVTKACRQPSGPYRVRGLVQVGDAVVLQLLPRRAGPGEEYRFVEVSDASAEDIAALLAERWAAGFDCLGAVSAGDGLTLCLFARPEDRA